MPALRCHSRAQCDSLTSEGWFDSTLGRNPAYGLESVRLPLPKDMKLLTPSRILTTLVTFPALFIFLRAPHPLGISLGQETSGGAAAARAQTGSEALLSTADSVFEEMSHITGWPIRSPLKKQLVGRADVQKYLTENLREEYTPKELHVQEATLKAFGLVGPEFDLSKFLITFYTEQAAGFYDPRRKTMCIADWVSADMQGLVLAHELTHALQDQNLDLDKFVHADRGNDDATNARQAVVEGYATAAMMQRTLGDADLVGLPSLAPLMESVVHQQMEEFPAFSSAPYFFRFQALFPYTAGMGFMQAGLKRGGWNGLKRVFINPPATTKEIFEPELYFEHKPLPGISLPAPAALSNVPHLEKLDENTMGQMGYYSLLGQLVSENETKSVSSGWLADRYILYEDSGAHRYTLVGRTRWSTPEKAASFCHDYHAILAHKHLELTIEKQSTTDLLIGSAANGRIVLLHKGDECLWAEGVPPSQADNVLNYLRSL